jgi:RND family efflux transporter MFP subunit
MTRTIIQRLGWPGLGLGMAILVAVQTGAAQRRLEPCAIAGSLGLNSPSDLGKGPLFSTSLDEEPRVTAEGRVAAYPGAEVVVSAEVPGRIVRLAVVEKTSVRKGDVIAELNSEDLRASLAEAEARIREAKADERFDLRELEREQGLLARRAGTVQNLDSLMHSLETARARRSAAAATRDRFAALIAKTRILAPIDGVVTARHVQSGETIEAATRLVTIVDLRRLRIEAEVDEYDAGRIALGAPVAIAAEGYSSSWQGEVEEIPDAVVGRKLRPEDPGRPIDARVLAVKVKLAGPNPLKIGQRVEVRIESAPAAGHVYLGQVDTGQSPGSWQAAQSKPIRFNKPETGSSPLK